MDIESFAIGLMVSAKNGGQPTSSPWTKLAEKDFTVNTSSTSATIVGALDCGAEARTTAKIIYVRVRDKAGKRNGYFYGTDSFFLNINQANGSTLVQRQCVTLEENISSDGTYRGGSNSVGIYPSEIESTGEVAITSKYGSGWGTIDGTYHVEVYTLEWPDNVSPFA